ncbi:hypothetical protein HPG69_009566 [Diceros bicornis minor]|uniref:Uncharacterized protein n=1 Tax=Diceros bicornis minor TaxID=77932 RepID=A0A7J7EME4_DICBM|nr:hypothetical protein HPG69_009566 [Diceros bicornis minor]
MIEKIAPAVVHIELTEFSEALAKCGKTWRGHKAPELPDSKRFSGRELKPD